MKTLRCLLLVVGALALVQPLSAQTVTIRATDASTGADVQRVGDDTNDALRVTLVSPATVPVSGTVAFSNSSIAVTGTFWQATQPVSVASLPLPSGAATAAKQPALGTAGTPSSDVISVQGVVGGVAQPVSGTVAATQSGTWTVLPGNTANTTAWLVTGLGGTFPATQSGTWSTRTQDGSGNAITSAARGSERALTVQIVDGSGTQVTSFGGSSSNAAASATGSAVPSSGSYTGINVSGTLRGWTGLSLGSHYAGTVAIVDGSGNQVTSFGGSGGTASNFGSAVPSTGTAAGFSDGTNMQAPRVFDGDSGAGTQYVAGVILRASGSGGTTEVGTAAAPLQVSLANTAANATAVKVDGSAVTQPVSGSVTVTQGTATSLKTQAENYQGGTAVGSGNPLQVTLANTGANATAVKVDGSAVTQPVSIASAVPVTDNAGSLTVDAPVGTPVFVRLSDGAAAITNLATNLAQVAGATVATGNGTASGSIRVALPTDGTGVVGLNAGTNLVGQVGRKNTFDSAQTVTTTTNFTSLGNGSGWSGGSITTSGCYDIRFRLQTKGSSASNTAYIDWYLASSIAGETTFDDAASSSTDQTFTASTRKNSRWVGGVLTNGTSAVTGSFSALDAFATLPGAIVPIAINSSGAALSSTSGDHVLKYECVR